MNLVRMLSTCCAMVHLDVSMLVKVQEDLCVGILNICPTFSLFAYPRLRRLGFFSFCMMPILILSESSRLELELCERWFIHRFAPPLNCPWAMRKEKGSFINLFDNDQRKCFNVARGSPPRPTEICKCRDISLHGWPFEEEILKKKSVVACRRTRSVAINLGSSIDDKNAIAIVWAFAETNIALAIRIVKQIKKLEPFQTKKALARLCPNMKQKKDLDRIQKIENFTKSIKVPFFPGFNGAAVVEENFKNQLSNVPKFRDKDKVGIKVVTKRCLSFKEMFVNCHGWAKKVDNEIIACQCEKIKCVLFGGMLIACLCSLAFLLLSRFLW